MLPVSSHCVGLTAGRDLLFKEMSLFASCPWLVPCSQIRNSAPQSRVGGGVRDMLMHL